MDGFSKKRGISAVFFWLIDPALLFRPSIAIKANAGV